MEYRVISKKSEDGSIGLDTVYVLYQNPFFQRPGDKDNCWRMQDIDGDSIPDECGRDTTIMCGEEGKYKKIECTGHHKSYFKIARNHFNEYLAGSNLNLNKKWQLGTVVRQDGETKANYSCGDSCAISLYDMTSDGRVDEAYLQINYFSISFVGEMPDFAHQMFQRAVLQALNHFVPGTFSPMLGEGEWSVGVITFSKLLNFSFNNYHPGVSSIFYIYNDAPLTFAPDPEVAKEPAKETETTGTSKSATGGDSYIHISESGGQMQDVTDNYTE